MTAATHEQLYTTKQAAEQLGRAPVTVRVLASRHGLGTKIGDRRFYTADDIAQLRGIDPRGGRPPVDGRAITYQVGLDELEKGPRKKDPARPPRPPRTDRRTAAAIKRAEAAASTTGKRGRSTKHSEPATAARPKARGRRKSA